MENSLYRTRNLRILLFPLLALLALSSCNTKPEWQVAPGSLTFKGQVGKPAPAPQAIGIRDARGGKHTFNLKSDVPWIHAEPASSKLKAGKTTVVQVSVDPCSEPGTQKGRLSLEGADSVYVEVARECTPAPGSLAWLVQFGTPAEDTPLDSIVDPEGNVYALGATNGTFIEGQEDENLFVVKYNNAGKRIWVSQVPVGHDENFLSKIALHSSSPDPAKKGEVYFVGTTYTKVVDDASNPNKTGDVIIGKMAADDGSVLWMRQLATNEDSNEGPDDLVVDAAGNVYVAGFTFGSFAEGDDKNYLDDVPFLASYDADGNLNWVFSFDRDQLYSHYKKLGLILDPEEHLILSGHTYNPGDDLDTPVAVGKKYWDVFVDKYDRKGKRLWRFDLASDDYDTTGKPLVDAHGNIYIYGVTNGTLPGQESAGASDAYVLKLDPDGKQIWLAQIGTSGAEDYTRAALDAEGNVYVYGSTTGAFPEKTAHGKTDLYLAKLNANDGSIVWVTQIGTDKHEEVYNIAVDAGGNPAPTITGNTQGSFPGYDLKGDRDPFIARFDPATGEQVWLTQFSSDDSNVVTEYTPANKRILDNNDLIEGLGLDKEGNAYIVGKTEGLYPGQVATPFGDVFIAKFHH